MLTMEGQMSHPPYLHNKAIKKTPLKTRWVVDHGEYFKTHLMHNTQALTPKK
jgi:hypothetical protein